MLDLLETTSPWILTTTIACVSVGATIVARGKPYGPGGFPRAVRWLPGQIYGIIKFLFVRKGDLRLAFCSARDEYGDIYYTRILSSNNKTVLVLNDPKDWDEVMKQETKLNLINDFPVTVEQIHGKGTMQEFPGGSHKHQLFRKIFSSLLAPKALACFTPIILDHFRKLWEKLEHITNTTDEDSPSNNNNNNNNEQEKKKTMVPIRDHVRDTQFELMCKILYGIERDSNESEREIDRMRVDFEIGENGLFAPEGSKEVKDAIAASERNKEYLRKKFRGHLNDLARAEGVADHNKKKMLEDRDSPVGSAMETVAFALIKEGLEGDEDVIEDTVVNLNLLLEASHATSIYVTTNMLYMLSLPENKHCLEKLKAEVAGMPEPNYLSLKNEMPFAEGCINEALRLAPIVEVLLRAADSTKTFKIRGQVIPAPEGFLFGIVVPTLDANLFPEPTRFLPERWIKGDPMEVSMEAKQALRMMGIGRHICLGQSLARLSLKAALHSFASEPTREIQIDPTVTKIKKQAVFPNSLVNDGLMGRMMSSKS